MAAATRETKARKAAAAQGLTLEKDGRLFRLVDATTGTLVAADWSTGAGLPLEKIEGALG